MNDLLECPKCGWVHFGVTEAFVKDWEKSWAQWCKDWSEERLETHGIKNRIPPSRECYEKCFLCGNKDTKDFFPTKKDLGGHTIQPILWEKK